MVVVYSCSKDETVDPIRFHKDGKRVYMASDKGKDVNLPAPHPLRSGDACRKSSSRPIPRIRSISAAPSSRRTRTSSSRPTTWGTGSASISGIRNGRRTTGALQKQLPDGDVYLGSSTSDERLWLVGVTSDVDPGATYLYTRATGKAELLYRPFPDLPSKDLAPMKPIVYKSRDGFDIHGYLTVPKGVKEKNLPVLCMVHGGPWSRDEWGYDPYSQFFANRGYAVFQMNFRGSSGYGKAFLNAGNKQWGDAMQNDITDGVEYLVKKGIADPKQIAIFGGSYGGYATLAGLAFTPDLYAAGISYVGPSNIITLLNSIPPYWAVLKTLFNERVGDPSKPEDAERLKRQSPLFSAEKIKAPLLVVQGANDPRVKKAESDQIVVALRDLGRDVEYIVAPDEGHGFAGVDNRTAFSVAAEKFLAKHLGGRYQETMNEKVRTRLDALTVDVKTVALAAPPKAADDAVAAPLPAVDASLLKPMTLTYKGSARAGGEEVPLEIVRSLTKGTAGGRGDMACRDEPVERRGERGRYVRPRRDDSPPAALECSSGHRDGRHRLHRDGGQGRRQDGRAGNADRRHAPGSRLRRRLLARNARRRAPARAGIRDDAPRVRFPDAEDALDVAQGRRHGERHRARRDLRVLQHRDQADRRRIGRLEDLREREGSALHDPRHLRAAAADGRGNDRD